MDKTFINTDLPTLRSITQWAWSAMILPFIEQGNMYNQLNVGTNTFEAAASLSSRTMCCCRLRCRRLSAHQTRRQASTAIVRFGEIHWRTL
ncbi:MAG: hypothetical protein R3C09_27110 [Pirellulaceae bacterium]